MNMGVKQGDNPRPTSFNLYLSDLPDLFNSGDTSPPQLKDPYNYKFPTWLKPYKASVSLEKSCLNLSALLAPLLPPGPLHL